MTHKLIFCIALCIGLINVEVSGFSQPLDASSSNYVVIGAFASRNNATQFVEYVKKLNFNPITEINTNRNLYYVYVLRTDNKKSAFMEANKIRVLHSDDLKAAFFEVSKIRKETPFYDTWVYTGVLGDSVTKGVDINPTTEKTIANVDGKNHKKVCNSIVLGDFHGKIINNFTVSLMNYNGITV